MNPWKSHAKINTGDKRICAGVVANLGGIEIFKLLNQNGQPLSWKGVLRLWEQNPDISLMFSRELAGFRHPAFFWETVPFALDTITKEFEMVLVPSCQLALIQADSRDFKMHLAECGLTSSIAVFQNLGGDSILVAPCQVEQESSCYAHMASFMRSAPAWQQVEFWKTLAAAIEERLTKVGNAPIWVSTSGLGVHWLHARLDSNPKYYQYSRFKHAESQMQTRLW